MTATADQPVMLRRRDAAQATLDQFKDKPFAWGVRDCARLVAAHLRRLGHKVRLPASGSYRSPKSALVAMRDLGHEGIAEAVDAIGLPRIAPAAILIGDIVMADSEDRLGALGIYLGNGRIVGFHPDAIGAAVLKANMGEMTAAWRCDPLP